MAFEPEVEVLKPAKKTEEDWFSTAAPVGKFQISLPSKPHVEEPKPSSVEAAKPKAVVTPAPPIVAPAPVVSWALTLV